MHNLKAMLRSIKIPSLTQVRAKLSKTTSKGSGKEATSQSEYIEVCEKILSNEFKELQLFGQQNKEKMKLIEQCQKLMEKLRMSYSTNNDAPELYKYLQLTGMHKGGGKLYKKVYKNYDEFIADQFGVKSFMKSFSPKIKTAKTEEDFNSLDGEIRVKIASMRTFLDNISLLLNGAYSVASGFIEEIKEYDRIGGKGWSQIKEQFLKELDDMYKKTEPLITKQMDSFGDIYRGFSEDLRTNKDINLVEQFLSKNKGKVNSYAQIMKYSNLIGNYKDAVEFFDKKIDLVELTAKVTESAGLLKSISTTRKDIVASDATGLSGRDKYSFYRRNMEQLRSKRDKALAMSHDLLTKETQKMKELRDKIVLVANEAAKEIEGLRVHFKGDPQSGLNFEGIGGAASHDVVISKGKVRELRDKLEGAISTSQQTAVGKGVKMGKKVM